MKRIVVTGASGFIGRHAVAALIERGFDVHAISRRSESIEATQSHTCDIFDAGEIRRLLSRLKPSHVLHLAWSVSPGNFWTAPENIEWVAASLTLYRAFAAEGGRRFVGAGTCAEYDWGAQDPLMENVTPCRPATLYGVAKDSVRRLLVAASQGNGLAFAWGRIFFLYGPGEKPGRLTSDIIAGLLAGQIVETTHGNQVRDFMHVADVGRAFAALCDSELQGPVNIASGEGRPLREMILRLGELTGRADLLKIGARAAPPQEPARLTASVTRLREDVGFMPRFDLESGLADTVEWWRTALARSATA